MPRLFLSLILLGFIPSVLAGELATDGEFEKSDDTLDSEVWGRFSSTEPIRLGLERDPLKRSNHVVRIEAHGDGGAYQGVFQTVPVKEGKIYDFSVKVLTDKKLPLQEGSAGVLSIEWLDAEGVEIAREETEWPANLSASSWKQQEIRKKAPDGAVKGRFVVLQRDREGATNPPGGVIYIDDFSIHEN